MSDCPLAEALWSRLVPSQGLIIATVGLTVFFSRGIKSEHFPENCKLENAKLILLRAELAVDNCEELTSGTLGNIERILMKNPNALPEDIILELVKDVSLG